MMRLEKQEFNELGDYIFKVSGLIIRDDKHYLVEQRLHELAKASGNGSYRGLVERLRQNNNTHLRDAVIEAITTNETSFFRDTHPFEMFKSVILPALEKLVIERKQAPAQRKGPKVRIWSAASSTGQEAYSLAMLINEHTTANGYKGITAEDFVILATDISNSVLARAMSGKYSDMELARGLSEERRKRYFSRDGTGWVINGNIQSIVEFRKMNITEPLTSLGGFDVIFCRNVLIYFSEDAKKSILLQMRNILTQDGYLVLGACESAHALTDEFVSVAHGPTIVYKPKPKYKN